MRTNRTRHQCPPSHSNSSLLRVNLPRADRTGWPFVVLVEAAAEKALAVTKIFEYLQKALPSCQSVVPWGQRGGRV